MRHLRTFMCVAALTTALPALAAAPADELALPEINKIPGPSIEHFDETLGKEQFVFGWILCVNQYYAEALLMAHDNSPAMAAQILDVSTKERGCERIKRLRIILKEELILSWPRTGSSRAWSAEILLRGKRPLAYVIQGIPDVP